MGEDISFFVDQYTRLGPERFQQTYPHSVLAYLKEKGGNIAERIHIFLLGEPYVSIGRGSMCEIYLTDDIVPQTDLEKISRRHGELKIMEGNWAYGDTKSVNGVALNGRQLNNGELIGLKNADELKLGKRVLLTFYDPAGFKDLVESTKRVILNL